jgi:hypothetical protein
LRFTFEKIVYLISLIYYLPNNCVMRKTVLATIVFAFFVIISVSFIKKEGFDKAVLKEKIISCLPSNEESIAEIFSPSPHDITLVRKNIETFTTKEYKDLRTAIEGMKKDSITFMSDDLTVKGKQVMSIWDFQSALHGQDFSVKKLNNDFRQCIHHKKPFLAWHRMYLYFFERILHKYMPKSSDTLGLPYWDYQTYSKLPNSFSSKTANSKPNPLYDDTRDITIKNGGHLAGYDDIKKTFVNSRIYKEIEFAMQKNEYYSFQLALESPHGLIHTGVGGNLGNLTKRETAAKDPIFWLNHSNVDRLWEKWLKQGGDRCNPTNKTDTKWWNDTYYFYDENNKRVAIKCADIVNISKNLNYKYDSITSVSKNPDNCKALNPSLYAALGNPKKKYSVNEVKIDNTDDNDYGFASSINNYSTFSSLAFIPNYETSVSSLNFFSNDFYVEFENIKAKTMPSGVIEIYIANKGEKNYFQNENCFVGLFDLFTALSIAADGNSNHEHKMGDDQDAVYRININEILKKVIANNTKVIPNPTDAKSFGLGQLNSKLKNSFEELKNLRIHFKVRGNVLNGAEVKKSVNITIGTLSLAAYEK